MPGDVKFSQFTVGGNMRQGDQPVGLRTGSPTENFIFSFPGTGIEDANGNFMVGWESVGAGAVNYPIFSNATTGNPALIQGAGSDTNVGVSIQPQGIAPITLGPNTLPTTALTNGELLIGSTGNPLVASTLTAGSGVNITNGPGSIQISTSGSSMSWVNVTGTSQAAAANTGYVIASSSQTTVTLPVAPAIGSPISIAGLGAGGWVVLPGSGQTIQVGSATASTSVTSSNQYDSVTFVYLGSATWSSLTGPQTAGFTIA
jgi:hypothetical protein